MSVIIGSDSETTSIEDRSEYGGVNNAAQDSILPHNSRSLLFVQGGNWVDAHRLARGEPACGQGDSE
jgi:hypothetical protein